MKRIKMALYAEPGVGKSVFASKFPKPFFVTTDGNYEWLIDFGADPNAHQRVSSWAEAKKLFKTSFDGYETIVLDLTEDLFLWCENEWCKRNEIEHPSDMGWGKGYQGPRNEFFIEISKLLSLDKHIILLMHGESVTVKNKRGVEFTTYKPTSRLPEKLLDQIEGRLRYFLRAYIGSKEVEGKVLKKRFLSLVPKEDEYGIIRGVDENEIPQTIPLDFDIFWNTVVGAEKPVKIVKEPEEVNPEEFVEESTSNKKGKSKKIKNKSGIDDGLTDEEREAFKKKMEESNSKYKKEMEELESKSTKDVTEITDTEVLEVKEELTKEQKIAALKAKMGAKKEPEKEALEAVEEVEEAEEETLTKEQKIAALKAKMKKVQHEETEEPVKPSKRKLNVVEAEEYLEVSEEKAPKELSKEEKLAALKAKMASMKK